jgi:hypothetical protein
MKTAAGLLCGLILAGAPPCGAQPAKEPYNLAGIWDEPGFWEKDAAALDAFEKKSPFRWVSQERAELRAAGAPMVYLGLPVVEAVVRLAQGRPREVFLSVYNRGDLGRVGEDDFEALLARTVEAVGVRAGVPSEDLGDALKRSGLRAQSLGWITPQFCARLDAAYSRVREEGRRNDRPEFVNLTLYPPGTGREGMLVQRRVEMAAADLPGRVIRLENKDVRLGTVPMVDQGQKGYCAVATMERILRYYGIEVNQHELAQQANADGQGGTNPEALVKALKGMGSKMGLRVDDRETFEWKDFSDMLDDYDKAAKRKKLPPVVRVVGNVIDLDRIYASLDQNTFREVRLKRASRVEKFFNETAATIDQGKPLAWGVQLGLVPEKPALPQASGGHMRLIIGYNPVTREILYSDSWGLGHEEKRMSLEDAYVITTGLMVVEPRS